MNDPSDLSHAPGRRPGAALRPLLWVLLAVGLAGNVVVSGAGANVIANVMLGLLTAGSAAALIVQHYRARRR
ncbi:hypothetical protein [Actinomadura sp. NTSP31]|uniref:hypothetical protein n=1 Tax=Actinomadura sp. NTSP31 TaxID=1735447 RepID=UPI0035C071CF